MQPAAAFFLRNRRGGNTQLDSATEQTRSSREETGPPKLQRVLGLWAVIAFGVGDILGAGVYGLVGKISGLVGYAAWMSYVAAAMAAALTGLTYAEFTSRYPRAGGAAFFTRAAFGVPLLTFLVIFFVVLSGLFSVATASRVFANYAAPLLPQAGVWAADHLLPLGFVVIVAMVTARGILFSSAANVICSVIEVGALLLIIGVGLRYLGSVNYLAFAPAAPAGEAAPMAGFAVLGGASLAFFAFIGFEDMANLSEEVKNPERNVPLAICGAVAITSLIYCLISLVAVSVVPPAVLAATRTPLIDVVKTASPSFPIGVYSVVPAFAVFNTGLLNLLMASRLLYGMSRGPEGQLPRVFSRLHPVWRTPVISLALSALVVMVMILASRDVSRLAAGTTTFLLVVFALLHIGLIRLKLAGNSAAARPRFSIPIVFPALGLVICLALLAGRDAGDYAVAGGLTAAAVLLFLVNRKVLGRTQVDVVE